MSLGTFLNLRVLELVKWGCSQGEQTVSRDLVNFPWLFLGPQRAVGLGTTPESV